jgi:hypothetical protein
VWLSPWLSQEGKSIMNLSTFLRYRVLLSRSQAFLLLPPFIALWTLHPNPLARQESPHAKDPHCRISITSHHIESELAVLVKK